MKAIKTTLLFGLMLALLVPWACIAGYRWLSLHLVYDGDKALRDRISAGY